MNFAKVGQQQVVVVVLVAGVANCIEHAQIAFSSLTRFEAAAMNPNSLLLSL